MMDTKPKPKTASETPEVHAANQLSHSALIEAARETDKLNAPVDTYTEKDGTRWRQDWKPVNEGLQQLQWSKDGQGALL